MRGGRRGKTRRHNEGGKRAQFGQEQNQEILRSKGKDKESGELRLGKKGVYKKAKQLRK